MVPSGASALMARRESCISAHQVGQPAARSIEAGRTARMKVREVIRVLTDSGFRQVRQNGSHRQFEGFVNGQRRLVTVAGKGSVDLKAGTLAAIRQQSGLPRKLFR